MAREVGCGGTFLNYLSKPTSTHYKREGGAPHFNTSRKKQHKRDTM